MRTRGLALAVRSRARTGLRFDCLLVCLVARECARGFRVHDAGGIACVCVCVRYVRSARELAHMRQTPRRFVEERDCVRARRTRVLYLAVK